MVDASLGSAVSWVGTLMDLLECAPDEAVCWQALVAQRPSLDRGTIQLVEGPLAAREVLTYAHALLEFGASAPARELMMALAFGPVDVPQGSQFAQPTRAVSGTNSAALA